MRVLLGIIVVVLLAAGLVAWIMLRPTDDASAHAAGVDYASIQDHAHAPAPTAEGAR